MTKEEFFLKVNRDMIDSYKNQKRVPPTFTLLFRNGSTKSINLLADRRKYKFIMHTLNEIPDVTASIFTGEAWLSTCADETKYPIECWDREEVIMLICSTRINTRECHIYKPTKNGELEYLSIKNSFAGDFSNPYCTSLKLENSEVRKSIEKFRSSILDSLSHVYEKIQYVVPILFFLSKSQAEAGLCWIPEEEWIDKICLKQRIYESDEVQELITFFKEFPAIPNMESAIVLSCEVKENTHPNNIY